MLVLTKYTNDNHGYIYAIIYEQKKKFSHLIAGVQNNFFFIKKINGDKSGKESHQED